MEKIKTTSCFFFEKPPIGRLLCEKLPPANYHDNRKSRFLNTLIGDTSSKMVGLCRIFHCHVSFLRCFPWKHDHLKKAQIDNHEKNPKPYIAGCPQGATQVAYLVGGPRRSGAAGAMCEGVVYRKPWETHVSFIFRGYFTHTLGFKTLRFFMVFGVQR